MNNTNSLLFIDLYYHAKREQPLKEIQPDMNAKQMKDIIQKYREFLLPESHPASQLPEKDFALPGCRHWDA